MSEDSSIDQASTAKKIPTATLRDICITLFGRTAFDRAMEHDYRHLVRRKIGGANITVNAYADAPECGYCIMAVMAGVDEQFPEPVALAEIGKERLGIGDDPFLVDVIAELIAEVTEANDTGKLATREMREEQMAEAVGLPTELIAKIEAAGGAVEYRTLPRDY